MLKVWQDGINRARMFSGVKGADRFLMEVISEYLYLSKQYQNLTEEDIQTLQEHIRNLTAM